MQCSSEIRIATPGRAPNVCGVCSTHYGMILAVMLLDDVRFIIIR